MRSTFGREAKAQEKVDSLEGEDPVCAAGGDDWLEAYIGRPLQALDCYFQYVTLSQCMLIKA